MTPEKCVKKVYTTHILSRQFSHIKLVVVGFLCEAVRGGQFSVDFWKYLAVVVETEVISQLYTKGLITIGICKRKNSRQNAIVMRPLLNLFALQT